MKRYRATTKGGSPIISVWADDEEEARARIREQLAYPGRRPFLRQWEESGEIIEAGTEPTLKIGLVACSKAKASRPAPARELYQGRLFGLAAAYAEQTCDNWYILSAKHGLVHPGSILEPYDVSLHDMDTGKRRRWADDILNTLRSAGYLPSTRHRSLCLPPSTSWVVLAGRRYREFLIPGLTGDVETPLAGLGIGEQIAWLGEQCSLLDCRICQVAQAGSDGLCDGCRSATIVERSRTQ